jgi:hypothetical protein
MGWKKSEEKIIPIPEDMEREKGEGIKTPIIPVIEKKEYHEDKKSSGWQKKFLGIPTWTWLVAGAILVFAVFMVVITLAAR